MDIRAFCAPAVIPRLAQEDELEDFRPFILDMEKLMSILERYEREKRRTTHFLRATPALSSGVLLIEDLDDEIAFDGSVIEVFLRRKLSVYLKHSYRGPQT